jgi:hypothetical protein
VSPSARWCAAIRMSATLGSFPVELYEKGVHGHDSECLRRRSLARIKRRRAKGIALAIGGAMFLGDYPFRRLAAAATLRRQARVSEPPQE